MGNELAVHVSPSRKPVPEDRDLLCSQLNPHVWISIGHMIFTENCCGPDTVRNADGTTANKTREGPVLRVARGTDKKQGLSGCLQGMDSGDCAEPGPQEEVTVMAQEESRTQYIVGALRPRSLLDIWRKRMNFFETNLHLERSVSPAGAKNARSVAVTFTLDSPVPGPVLGTEGQT
ncbi:uncharacterized protein LOC116621635 [Phoca vitulina]|uniref:uncharacterized protein LOC116621635 n=1 Tax=Phoca vitulina TaxID=9720 RepID=UPI001396464D|nr:uncharacterized protein LOC116621635 [Phoca vitulina]